jgi:DNA-binding beta-propeller fold protein YncE
VRSLLVAALYVALIGAAPEELVSATPLSVPGPPSSLALSADGGVLYVGIDQHLARGGGIAAFRRAGGALTQIGFADVPGGAQGVALTPDGRTLVATTRVGLAWLPTESLIGDHDAAVATLRVGAAPATNQIIVARDGAHAFFTNAATAALGIARIDRSPSGVTLTLAGSVALDRAPAGVALSPDGATIYVTSEVAARDVATPPELVRATCASSLGGAGTLTAVDAGKAITDPAHAVVGRVGAGCSPVRVALSSRGDVAWVTARGDDRVIAFDTTRLRNDPAHALLTSVAVGDVPVGLALSADGARLAVADSYRSRDADVAKASAVTILDAAQALGGGPQRVVTVPSGALAREVLALPDGSFLVTNYNAKSILVITPPRADDRRDSQP